MQRQAILWITGAFHMSPSEGVEAIASLIPITLHLQKLNSRHHLWYASILSSHAINSLLNSQHAKNQPLYKAAISNLTVKQQAKLKSPIKDVNECLNSVYKYFDLLNPLFSPGSRIVNHFPSRISFHLLLSSSDSNLFSHIQNLNNTFSLSQTSHNSVAVITDGGIKKSHVTTAVAHIWFEYSIIKQLYHKRSLTCFVMNWI